MGVGARTGRPRRRWWQVALRAGLIAVLVLAIAYVALPWWAPAGAIRDLLARRMAEQMGVNVRIGEMSLSWSRGIELRGLVIGSPPGFGDEPLVRVERIRADLSPIDFFLRRRLDWMEIDRPHLFARMDREGNVNLHPLAKLQFDVQARRISVREGTGLLKLPAYDAQAYPPGSGPSGPTPTNRVIRLNVRDLQLTAGKVNPIGRVTMSADLEQRGPAAPVSLHLSEGSNQDPDAGTATFTFADIDLAQMPLAYFLSVPVRKFDGRCRGSLELKVSREGVVNQFALDVVIRNLDVQPEGPPGEGLTFPVIAEAGVHISAAYDLITGRLDVRSARFRLPGIDLAGNASVFVDMAQSRVQTIRSLELSGDVYPQQIAALLKGRAELLEEFLPEQFVVQGPLHLKVSLDHGRDAVGLDLSVGCEDAAVRHAGTILKPRGRPCALWVKGSLNHRTWQFAIREPEHNELVLGGNRFWG
ncbi:MAG TPA: hypothetical protein VMZ50_09300, partial [Phycisphaerae bacterium]|nr:hypothetical protein [Phycisphaerae bacterium]